MRSSCAWKCSAKPREIPYRGHGGPVFDTGRMANVLRLCAEKIRWKEKRNDGRGIGIACHFTFGGYTAHAFEVSMDGERLRIHRAVCVVDVGRVVNPLGLEAQMMGGTIDGISTALNLAITVRGGQVEQKNFPHYPLLKMADAPKKVEVQIVESDRRSGRRRRNGHRQRRPCPGQRDLRDHHRAHPQAAAVAGTDADALSAIPTQSSGCR